MLRSDFQCNPLDKALISCHHYQNVSIDKNIYVSAALLWWLIKLKWQSLLRNSHTVYNEVLPLNLSTSVLRTLWFSQCKGVLRWFQCKTYTKQLILNYEDLYVDGVLPKGPYPPCLRMADRTLLAGYHRCVCACGGWGVGGGGASKFGRRLGSTDLAPARLCETLR